MRDQSHRSAPAGATHECGTPPDRRRRKALHAVLVALVVGCLAQSLAAQSDVSTLQFSSAGWTWIPTTNARTVTSFVGLRSSSSLGDNITAVWLKRLPDGTWQSWAWREPNQPGALSTIKGVLQLPDSSDVRWPVAPGQSAPAPEPLRKGLLDSDPLLTIVESVLNPRELVTFLEAGGWRAAWIDIWDQPCTDVAVLDSWAAAVETAGQIAAQPGGISTEELSAFQTTVAEPCPCETCVPVLRSFGQVLVVTAGDPGALLAEGRFQTGSEYTIAPERIAIGPGQIMVDGLLYNNGSAPAVLQMGNGVQVSLPGGSLAAVVNTYSGCKNRCMRILPVISPTLAWATMCIDARCFCKCWAESQPQPPTWLGTLPNCPCQLSFDPSGEPMNPDPEHWYDPESGSQTYHPGSATCMRSVPAVDGGPGQQCCYDASGALITVGGSAGTPDMIAPDGWWDAWTHWKEDVEPFNYCKSAGLLDCYLHHRPPNNGNGCACNPPGHPHFNQPPQCP